MQRNYPLYVNCTVCGGMLGGIGPVVISELNGHNDVTGYAHQECWLLMSASKPRDKFQEFYDATGRMPWHGDKAREDGATPYQGMRPAHTEAGLMDLLDNLGFTRGVIEWRDGTIDFYLDEKQVTPHRVKSMTYHRMAGVGWNFKTLKSDIPHGSFVMIKSKPRVAAT